MIKALRDKVFAVAWDMWCSEGSESYCRAILGIYADITNRTIESVVKEWEKEIEGLEFGDDYLKKRPSLTLKTKGRREAKNDV